jgi:hypothetical protein
MNERFLIKENLDKGQQVFFNVNCIGRPWGLRGAEEVDEAEDYEAPG